MTTKKNRSILRTLRTLLDVKLKDIKYTNGAQIQGILYYEAKTANPLASTVECIAHAYGLKPDILLYSFGYLPKKEKAIISSDPFYYSEKIKELCDNHNNRYGKSVDIDILNMQRCAEYIANNRVEYKRPPRKKKKENEKKD